MHEPTHGTAAGKEWHMISTPRMLAALLASLLLASSVSAQTQAVTPTDIQRLQDDVYLAERDIAQLRSRDTSRAGDLQVQLDDLRDEVVYLKVKLRKERALSRNEYNDVRERIESVRVRARDTSAPAWSAVPPSSAPSPSASAGGSTGSGSATSTTSSRTPAPATSSTSTPRSTGTQTSGAPPATGPSTTASSANEIPSGTEIDVRLQTPLNSGTAQVEDYFEATTVVDMVANDGRVLVPAGSVMRGVVTTVEPATRTNRTARLAVNFDRLTVNGRTYEMRGTVTEAIEGSGIKGEAVRIGAGAGVGAIIGGILGGGKGALAGILIGGGGTIAATEGKEVELEQGSVLRVRFDSAVQLRR